MLSIFFVSDVTCRKEGGVENSAASYSCSRAEGSVAGNKKKDMFNVFTATHSEVQLTDRPVARF